MATLTETQYTSDTLKEVLSVPYSTAGNSNAVAQDIAATEDLVAGTPMLLDSGGWVATATGALTEGLLYKTIAKADLIAGDVPSLIVLRGPAIVNEDQINIDGAELADCVAALAALDPPILTIAQGATSTQST